MCDVHRYPGTVEAKVVYSIPADGMDLNITQSATTDKATPINMLNHAYFNLKGTGSGDVLDHIVQVSSHCLCGSLGLGNGDRFIH